MINDLKKLVKDSAHVNLLADALEYGPSRALIHAMRVLRDQLRKEVEDNPQRNDTELRKDIIYKLGVIYGLNWALSIPTKARKHISLIEGREVE